MSIDHLVGKETSKDQKCTVDVCVALREIVSGKQMGKVETSIV